MTTFSSASRLALVPAVAIVCLIAVPGCGSKVDAEHYAKITTGMSEADVHSILGSPTSTDTNTQVPGASKQTWKNGDKSIDVLLVDGKVFATDKSGFYAPRAAMKRFFQQVGATLLGGGAVTAIVAACIGMDYFFNRINIPGWIIAVMIVGVVGWLIVNAIRHPTSTPNRERGFEVLPKREKGKNDAIS